MSAVASPAVQRVESGSWSLTDLEIGDVLDLSVYTNTEITWPGNLAQNPSLLTTISIIVYIISI